MCAYFRHYYPYEFITSYLNNAASQDDLDKGVELAMLYGIKVTSPKFGVSKENFAFDKDKKIITKGLGSIKYFNLKVGKELFDLAHSRKFERFTDLLFALKETSINSRQLDILIKIGFFSDFGNTVELSRINCMFEQMKCGDVKKIKRAELSDDISEVISRHGTCKNAKGEELKSFTITDPVGLIRELEDMIMSLHLNDVSLKTRIANYKELLGSVDIATHNPEDRRKLYVDNIRSLSKNGKTWGFSVDTVSVGSGKKSNFTLYTDKYNSNPIYKDDIISCDSFSKNKKGYWILEQYQRI